MTGQDSNRETTDVVREGVKGGERCGCWIQVADYETSCALPVDHDGPCSALRSELMGRIEWMDRESDALSTAVSARDAVGGWPYEGPEDERPATTGECAALVSSLAFTPSIILLYACLALAATLLAAAFYLVLRDVLGDEGWPMLDEARREIREGLNRNRDTTASQSMSESVKA